MKTIRIALAQINTIVGNFEKNVSKISNYIKEAKKHECDIIAFPELAITGYPPEDLLLKPQFIDDNLKALEKIIKISDGITTIVGFVDRDKDIFNAAAIINNKRLIDVYHKMYLPNYGVFDEYRYFQIGTRCPIYKIYDSWVGINICEDIWYPEGPARLQALAGAELIININASPYHIGKGKFRESMLATRANDYIVNIAYLNTVGGQDELVFDGHSIIIDQDGNIIARGKQFEEDLIVVDLNLESIMKKRLHTPLRRQEVLKLPPDAVEKITLSDKLITKKKSAHPFRSQINILEPSEEIYKALVLGTYDYVTKNGFKSVVIGLSGGIDSALVSVIAVDALGRKNVNGIFMPSPYTSKESREDVFELSKNLGINVIEVPITKIYKCYLDSLKTVFKDLPMDATEENIQARIRGNILMAFSNKFSWLVLTTGNKSEMSVGYATLYGDMAGGFAVIKDVPKTMVYELCKWRNEKENRIIIPERMFTKQPSAELKPGQKDTDVLPPYSTLDPILKLYIEDDKSYQEIKTIGFDEKHIRDVIKMVDRSEYKRRQAPPGIKITQRAFGRDRRFPITNQYRDF